MNASRNLLADGGGGHIGAGQPDHQLQPAYGIFAIVGVNRGQRSVVSGVHRLQHVENFIASHLADNDAVRPHAQAVDQQMPLFDRPFSFDVRRAGFHRRHVLLTKVQLRGVLDRDDPFILPDVLRQHVQQRRFSCSRAADNENVEA